MMATLVIDRYLTPELKRKLLKWTRVFQTFIAFLILLPTFLFTAAVILLCRLLIIIYLKLVHHGKFALCSPTDSAFAYENRANSMTITTFAFVKGKLKVDELREKVLNSIMEYETEGGRKPYQKLTWKLCQKFGFFAWDTQNNSFRIEDHIKICHGVDSQTVYSEQEVQRIGEKLLGDTIVLDPKLPLWELLYIPKVSLSEDTEPHFALIFRLNHAYLDGISLFQVFSRAIFDEPGKLAFDPTNPPWKLTTMAKIALYAQAFFMAPYTYYCLWYLSKKKNVFHNHSEYHGPKYYNCNSKEITFDSLKSIRNRIKCSTISVFVSVITGALRRAAKRKNIEIPDQVNFAFTSALLPYPNNDPQNRFTLKLLQTPMSIADPELRLSVINSVMKSVQPHEIIALYALSKIVGILPSKWIGLIYSTANCGFVVSNVPGFVNKLRISDGSLTKLYGAPPLKSGIGFSVGFTSYLGKVLAACIVEQSEIISSREEMAALMDDFDKEFASLECIANGNQNDIKMKKKSENEDMTQ